MYILIPLFGNYPKQLKTYIVLKDTRWPHISGTRRTIAVTWNNWTLKLQHQYNITKDSYYYCLENDIAIVYFWHIVWCNCWNSNWYSALVYFWPIEYTEYNIISSNYINIFYELYFLRIHNFFLRQVHYYILLNTTSTDYSTTFSNYCKDTLNTTSPDYNTAFHKNIFDL